MQRTPATTPAARPAGKIVGGLVMTAAAIAVLGCGGDPSEVDKFVGIWEYDLSNVSQSCSDGSTASTSFNGLQRQFFQGVTSDLVDPSASELFLTGPCDFKYDVAKGVATMLAGQTCAILDSTTLDKVATEAPSDVTFGLRGDGTELQEDWTAMEASTDGTFSCTTTIQGHLKKIAKN